MSHYHWSVRAVPPLPVESFATALEHVLNALEDDEYEVDDILDAPGGHAAGVVVVGKKPRRFPMTQMPLPHTGTKPR